MKPISIISKSTVSSTNAKTLAIFNCAADGLCKRNSGFISDGDSSAPTFYNVKEDSSDTIKDSDYATDCSTDESIGKLIKTSDDKSELCIALEKSVGLPASGTANYIISVTSTTSNGNGKRDLDKRKGKSSSSTSPKASTTPTSGYQLVRATDKVFAMGSISGIEDGLNVVILDTVTSKKPSDMTAAEINAGLSSLTIFDCDGTAKVCQQTYGYLKSKDATPTYYDIPVSGSNVESDSSVTDCSAGKLAPISGVMKLCLSISNTEGIAMEDNKEYLLDISAASTFTSEKTANNNVIIKTTANSITLKLVDKGYSVLNVDATTKAITSTFSSTTLTNNGIYKCSDKNTCEVITGYIINESTFYKVTVSSGTVSVAEATKATITDVTASDYCGSNIGEIFTLESTDYLCLDKNIHIELTSSNSGHYVLGASVGTNSPLTAKSMIIYNEKYIVVDSFFEGNK